ncbi:MAG: funZ protein [Candidatus Omnitrophica bacterium]|nr:funZ protein [Candidatus Omnitrophota bacterium]
MQIIPNLNFGFKDAENYKRKENRELFNKIFLRTDAIDKLCQNNIFFLLGEKGTGKTAYAVYLINNNYKNTTAILGNIGETEYQKFITLKKEKHLSLSDYANIWKVIIYLLLSEKIFRKEISTPQFSNFSKFRDLKKAIDEYYANAFTPEIIYALSVIEQSKIVAELIAKYAKAGGEESSQVSFTENRFQTNLLYIQKHFEDALRVFKLSGNHVLFIDGIDTRPSSIPYEDYLECVKGLASAIWSINNDFFSSIKDSGGRLRVVLIARPDIFDKLELHNRNNKIGDNSVLLDWQTTYNTYRTSPLFSLTDRLLSSQQNTKLSEGQAWDYYFPYTISSRGKENDSSFISFLRYSYYRPRDIITMLIILRDNFNQQGKNVNSVFSQDDFDHLDFRRKYSEYLLGEIKDHLAFYYSPSDYQLFLKFFEYLKGKVSFSYSEYLEAFKNYSNFLDENIKKIIMKPTFVLTADGFLQFLYELNIICYVEETEDSDIFLRFCFRERNPSDISPKVKTHLRYEIFYGISRALNLGKKLK